MNTCPLQSDPQDDEFNLSLRQLTMTDGTSETPAPTTHSLTIDVPGTGKIYKSTLVSLLMTGDNLSKDRLRRVQAPTDTDTLNIPVNYEIPDDEMSLLSDVLFYY